MTVTIINYKLTYNYRSWLSLITTSWTSYNSLLPTHVWGPLPWTELSLRILDNGTSLDQLLSYKTGTVRQKSLKAWTAIPTAPKAYRFVGEPSRVMALIPRRGNLCWIDISKRRIILVFLGKPLEICYKWQIFHCQVRDYQRVPFLQQKTVGWEYLSQFKYICFPWQSAL